MADFQDSCIIVKTIMYCDLHTHTTASDGSDTPDDLVRKAAETGLSAIAVTDHDTVAGLPEAVACGPEYHVEIIPGLELSVLAETGNMHILGYFIDPEAEYLKKILKKVQAARAERNPRILELLTDLGRPLTMNDLEEIAHGGQIGRPHIARTMLRKGYVRNIGEAFARYLKKGAPAYAPKSVLSPEEAIRTIHRAGGLAVLAHPFSLGPGRPADLEKTTAELAALGLDGMECYYSEHSREFTRQCLTLCGKYGLVVTGGSDYHGRAKPHIRLGTGRGNLRIPYRCVEELRARKTGSDVGQAGSAR